jgi:hypothetical protein
MKRIKPDIGHLVQSRKDSAIESDLGSVLGLVVGKTGISVEILLSEPVSSPNGSKLTVWCRRDNLEVVSESR